MPIPDTKYNFNPLYNYNKLKTDIQNNSFVYSNHILTCDLSDTLIFNDIKRPSNLYLNSKASFLIHPFSQVSNCMSQFSNNNNLAFKYKKPLVAPINGSTSHNIIQTQKTIQNQLSTSSSNYTQVISALSQKMKTPTDITNNSSLTKNKSSLDTKHNSYDRYLAKKKSGTLKTQNNQSSLPIKGNKTKYYSITTQNNNCVSIC